MDIDPRQFGNEAAVVTKNGGLCLSQPPVYCSPDLPLPPSPHLSSAQGTQRPMALKRQQPQGDLVTPLRSESSPVLILGHINSPTSYILL